MVVTEALFEGAVVTKGVRQTLRGHTWAGRKERKREEREREEREKEKLRYLSKSIARSAVLGETEITPNDVLQ